MIYLKIEDSVNGKQGNAYITIDGQMQDLPGLQKIEGHYTLKERTLNTVGTIKTQSAPAGLEGSGTMTIAYWAIKIFADIVRKYDQTGIMTRFDLLVENDDPGTSLGRRAASFNDCILTGDVPLAALDGTSDDGMTIDINYKFNEYIPGDEFSDPANVGRA